ncbi:uncharacterized protein L201_001122 [Kwoniella dendrophila CBS 6074]|uniref:RNase III domain-containing protein n=1 Tax=Kwoniella dendrophila CBS 6074 TaxID=1295534 RepID=A0AAX4JLG3_9TREE
MVDSSKTKRDIPPHLILKSISPRKQRSLDKTITPTTSPKKRKRLEEKKKNKEKKSSSSELVTSAGKTENLESPRKKRKKDKFLDVSELEKDEEEIVEDIKKKRKSSNKALPTTATRIPTPLSPKKHKKSSASKNNKNLTIEVDSEPLDISTQLTSSSMSLPSSTSSTTPTETLTTKNGTTLTYQNAGIILTSWGQSIGQQALEIVYRNVLSLEPQVDSPISNRLQARIKAAELEGRSPPKILEKGKEIDIHNPQDTLRECSITLPEIGIVNSFKPSEGGWKNKKLAKQSASFESVKTLYGLGKLDEDLKPISPKSPSLATTKVETSDDNDNDILEEIDQKVAKEVRLSTKSRSTKQWDEQKALIKSKLPPSPSESMVTTNGQSGVGKYKYLKSPSFWLDSPLLEPDQLYASSLELLIDAPYYENYNIQKSCRKLCLITSQPLNIFDENGMIELDLTVGDQQPDIGTKFRMIDHGKMKTWEQNNLEKALKFTERLLRAQLQKPFKGNLAEIKWLIVPLKPDFEHGNTKIGKKKKLQRKDISWDEIDKIVEGPIFSPFDVDNVENMKKQCEDGITTSSAEFSERRYIKSIRSDLKLSSPHPIIPNKTILGSLILQPELQYEEEDQIILELETIKSSKHGGIINSILFPLKNELNYLPIEILKLHCIPSSIYKPSTLLPYFFHQLDNLLISQELNNQCFSGLVKPKLLLNSLTTPSTNFYPNKNYERLEFLGDTILKFIITLQSYLFILNHDQYRNDDKNKQNDTVKIDEDNKKQLEEFFLNRHIITSNRSLQNYSVSDNLQLNKFIRSKRLKVKDWLPKDWDFDWNSSDLPANRQNHKLQKLSSDDMESQHDLGDKVLADVLEAIIGASYLTSRDFDDVLIVTHALGIPIKGLYKWSDIKYVIPPSISQQNKTTITTTSKTTNPEEKYMKFFKSKLNNENSILGYEFKNKSRIDQILSLDMNSPGRKNTFDKYRLLGNAILDYYIVENLFDKYPDEGPASLHNLKVSRTTEGVRSALCTELGLLDLLRDATDETRLQITKIRKAAKTAKARADQLRSKAIKEKKEDAKEVGLEWWTDIATSHSTSDPLEALIGAITHDSEFSFEPTRKIFHERILPFYVTYCFPPKKQPNHPKDELIKWLQSKGCSTNIHLSIERKLIIQKLSASRKNEEEEEIVVRFHGTEITKEKIEFGSGGKTLRKVCQFTLSFLKDQGGLEKLCNCKNAKKG